jgi:hypothetical protein
MKKLLFLCIIAGAATCIFAQEMEGPKPSAESRKYAVFRNSSTEPTYGLAKVKALVAKVKEDQDYNRRLSEKAFNALSFEEKFTYVMIHGEDFSQNCDMMPQIVDEHKKIFAFTPSPFYEEATWSDRQTGFLKNNRTKVIGLVRNTIKSRGRAGANLKQVIIQLSAVELIPDLVALYNRDHKDHDILTVFMNLMVDAKYKPFMATPTYKKMYADENTSYKEFLMATPANQKLVIGQATAFYKSWKK